MLSTPWDTGKSHDDLEVGDGLPVTAMTQGTEVSPEFRRFWWGEAVSGFGTAITSLALQTIVLVTLHGSAAQVG